MEIDEKYIDKNKLSRLKDIYRNINFMAKRRDIKLEGIFPLIFTTEYLPKGKILVPVDFDNNDTPKGIDPATKKFIEGLKEYFKTKNLGKIKALIIDEDYIDEKHRQITFSQDSFDQEYLKANPKNERKDFRIYFINKMGRISGIKPINYISENIYKKYDPKPMSKNCRAKTVMIGLIKFRDEHPGIEDYLTEIDKLHQEELRIRKKQNSEQRDKNIKPSDRIFDEFQYCSKTSLRNCLKNIMESDNNYIDKEKKRLSKLLELMEKNNLDIGKELIIDRISKLKKVKTASDLFEILPSDWISLFEILYY